MKLVLTVSLALLLLGSTTTALSIPTSCYRDNALYAHGDPVPDSDPCKSCRCDHGRVVCATPMCILPICSDGATPVNKAGKCCAYTCPPPTCLDPDTRVHHPVGTIDNGDDCKHCTCDPSGQIFCAHPMCIPPVCAGNAASVTKPGDCCPSCPEVTCLDDDGKMHPVGDMETNDPCKFCQCTESGQIMCAMPGCAPPICPGGAAPVQKTGECCPSCPTTCQEEAGIIHPVGKIETNDSCKSCQCQETGDITCAMMACLPPLCPEPVHTEGQCCPTCPPGCLQNGKWYEPGPIPSSHPCGPSCFCDGESGNVMCSMRVCAPIRCAGEMYTPEGQCCPVCRTYEV